MSELPNQRLPSRSVDIADEQSCTPVYAVWELTLACNLKCKHCGSRAGQK